MRTLLILLLNGCFLVLATVDSRAQGFAEEIICYRESYKQAFVEEANSPLEESDLDDLRFYEPDSTYKIKAYVTFIHDPEPFIIPTYSGVDKKYLRFAALNFKLHDEEIELTLFKSLGLSDPIYADYLFLPFTDATNDVTTYGGGRYLDLKRSDIKGNEIIIDFNKSYNPYCAYSAGYNCPIPPPENALNISVEAGEKKFEGKYKGERRVK
ncbi:DUF1684 domain-containing protein [Olivibacter sp. SDN3]|uniref:DUF1684 domain-containing protein n=1 Tax=Olivibacter sp. SDN3 TaxID=2764720 RepID=UPI001651536F|nr:DUF1684 domain-containing protein [Olivibacter sp. SDN3]QNL48564.1 DUF1684 domain-containing protein [Olivibacter sp. SDN3]